MATKKKVKAVEPEVFSSVEPEVAAVPMAMAAVTPRSNVQSDVYKRQYINGPGRPLKDLS